MGLSQLRDRSTSCLDERTTRAYFGSIRRTLSFVAPLPRGVADRMLGSVMQSDVQISDVRLRLDPRDGRVPFEPLVERLSLDLSSAAFETILRTGLVLMADRLPVEVALDSARLVDGGAEIVVKVKRSILKADLRVRLAFSVQDPSTIRVRIAELDAPAWVPTQFVLEQALNVAAAKPGFSRVPGDERAVDVNPATVIASRGIPLKLATPGAWSVDPTAQTLSVSYSDS